MIETRKHSERDFQFFKKQCEKYIQQFGGFPDWRIGFDFKEYGKGKLNNIYQDTQHYGPRDSDVTHEGWLTQFRICIKQRPYCQFTVVHDNPPEPLYHLQTGIDLKNTRLMTYGEFTKKVLNQ